MHIQVRQRQVRTLLRHLLEVGLQAVDPFRAVQASVSRSGPMLRIAGRRYDLRSYRSVVAVGAGKASARMAEGLERTLGSFLEHGLVVVKYGHTRPSKRIEIVEAGHPIPDRAGERGAARLLKIVQGLGPQDLLFVLISGGASSLLPLAAPGITLRDKQIVNNLLLRSGASIHEINAVRKHLSAIKGGRLAASCRAQVVTLLLSDVVGDDVASIGSGPTAPDPKTYRDAEEVLRRHELWMRIPASVRSHVRQGLKGRLPETPKPGASIFRRVSHHVIGSNAQAITAIARAAVARGIHPLVLTATLTGQAREVAKVYGALAREIAARGRPATRPACIIAGGELTVTVRGPGRGGRAQEFALAAAQEIEGLSDTWVVGFGTDGTDGPTEMAGAVVSGATSALARARGVSIEDALARNDSYAAFKRLGGHILTGPSGTNVSDAYLLLVL